MDKGKGVKDKDSRGAVSAEDVPAPSIMQMARDGIRNFVYGDPNDNVRTAESAATDDSAADTTSPPQLVAPYTPTFATYETDDHVTLQQEVLVQQEMLYVEQKPEEPLVHGVPVEARAVFQHEFTDGHIPTVTPFLTHTLVSNGLIEVDNTTRSFASSTYAVKNTDGTLCFKTICVGPPRQSKLFPGITI